MLAIRLKRTGRKGHAQFRMIVQDSHRSPMSGKVVAYVGSYNPHDKSVSIDKDEIERFLKNGAQPSNRVAMLLKDNGVKLPKWVKIDTTGKGDTRNPEKLRKNRPEEPAAAAEVSQEAAPAEEASTEEAPAEEAKEEAPTEEAPKEEKPEEAPAEEATKEESKEAEEPKAEAADEKEEKSE